MLKPYEDVRRLLGVDIAPNKLDRNVYNYSTVLMDNPENGCYKLLAEM
jgi:hypothetical protein